jgi:deazaflavin-dependent oxidoreductase (nitroreductase family)
MALLTVPGRKSGILRTIPIAVLPHGDGWRLMAPYGVVDWVKNLRAAGTAVLTRRGREIVVAAEEMASEEAAPWLRDSFAMANRAARKVISPYFSVDAHAPLAAWIVEARDHPVFILRPVADQPI